MGETKETDTEETELEEIDLQASGYEWECPVCSSQNKEIEGKVDLECRECETKFKLGELLHSYE